MQNIKDLKDKLNKIRETLKDRETKDKKARNAFKNVLTDLFPESKNPLRYVKDFYFQKDKIYIISANKVFANELFNKKTELLSEMSKAETRIKEVIIK
ncbi:MAG: hypothetical protein Q8Q06_01890 [bacterium]|nr:hypothetical protein [bacterium]